MHRSRLVAAIIDVPAGSYEPTAAFWAAALGAEPHLDPEDPDYVELGEPSPGFEVMVQRVGAAARVHLDIETDDVEAEVARLERLGAARVGKVRSWWVMRDPAGLLFCVVTVQMPGPFGRHATTWP